MSQWWTYYSVKAMIFCTCTTQIYHHAMQNLPCNLYWLFMPPTAKSDKQSFVRQGAITFFNSHFDTKLPWRAGYTKGIISYLRTIYNKYGFGSVDRQPFWLPLFIPLKSLLSWWAVKGWVRELTQIQPFSFARFTGTHTFICQSVFLWEMYTCS